MALKDSSRDVLAGHPGTPDQTFSADVLSNLQNSHQSELQRVQLTYAERIRQIEVSRLKLENKLELLEESYADLAENYRTETKSLNAQVAEAKDKFQQSTVAFAALEKRVGLVETQRDTLDVERRSLIEKLRLQSNELSIAQKTLDELTGHLRQKDAEVAQLVAQLAGAKEELQRSTVALAALEKRVGLVEIQRDALDVERRSLIEKQRLQDDELVSVQQQLRGIEEAKVRSEDELVLLKRTSDADIRRHAESVAGLSVQLSALQQDVVRYRSAMVEADRRAEAAKRTFSFRLGYALIHGVRSWESLKLLPKILLSIYRDAKRHRTSAVNKLASIDASSSREKRVAELESFFAENGLLEAEKFARAKGSSPVDLAADLTSLARLESRSNPNEALRLGRESIRLDPRAFRRKWLAFMLYDTGHISEAHELLLSISGGAELKPSERFKAEFIAGCYRLRLDMPKIPPILPSPVIETVPNSLLYVASSSQPYHLTGYTSRTHGIVKAIQNSGWDVTCVTRPGYPHDRPDSTEPISETVRIVDGVRYEILPGPHRRKTPLDQYLIQAADIIEAKARHVRPSIIQAASNYEAAIPALIAARRLGISFVYEVRGFWEFTAASKVPGWETTERFALDRQLESLAAANAQHVLTLTMAMAGELERRGVDRKKISLAPNAIDPALFQPIARDISLADSLGLSETSFVVGYIGSVVAYEGIDDLVVALGRVRQQVAGAKLLIVGDGDAMPSLRNQVRMLGLETDVIFTGKVPSSDVLKYFSLLSVVALPRKPFTVCQLVSPLKPLEAMSMKIPLVVSDVAALREMVKENETALVHKAGDVTSLTDCLIRIANDAMLVRNLVQAARSDVVENRSWKVVACELVKIYGSMTGGKKSLPRYSPSSQTMDLVAGEVANHLPSSENITPVPLSMGKNSMTGDEKSLFDDRLNTALKIGGASELKKLLERQIATRSEKFAAFCELKAANVLLTGGLIEEAITLAEVALEKDNTVSTVRGATRIYYNAAQLEKAEKLANQLEKMQDGLSEADRKFVDEVCGRAQLAKWAATAPTKRTIPLVKGRVLNVLAFSLPYTSVGYATRSHGLAIGIKNSGWDIRPYTRLGFPYDYKPELQGQLLPEQDEVDGIVYRRIFDSGRRGTSEVEYLFAAVAKFEKIIAEEQPEVVHAASNYVTALPALIAARRFGIPFIYEVRGFWEITRSSRDEEFINTAKYRYMQLFEGLIAQKSDGVITITSAMKAELVKRDVPDSNIVIAYNSVDPKRFSPSLPNKELAKKLGIPDGVPVIGYIGSFVDYEGLDDLITASAGLKKSGLDYRLLLVGDGAVFQSLKEQVKDLDLSDRVILTGRIPHEDVEDYYSVIDIAPFPRKPWEVCELVSPLKPFEAMALEKAVVVSSTDALMEIVDHGSNGLVFSKGNIDSLQGALAELITQKEKRAQLGKIAREWIRRERSWDIAGALCGECYRRIQLASCDSEG